MLGDEILNILNQKYPEVRSSLNFTNEIECLIAVILSARARDSEVNKVTKILFQKYKSFEEYVNADFEDLRSLIKPLGLSPQKAERIINLSKILFSKGYINSIPETYLELVNLPGVGRKTAIVVLHETKKIREGIAIDTHNSRIALRIGITDSNNLLKIENDMKLIFPKEKWRDISLLFVNLGREICLPKKPKCEKCPLNNICKYAQEDKKI